MAAKKTTYVATAPDGTEITRTSGRVYTHAVLTFSANEIIVRDENGEVVRGEDGRLVIEYSEPTWGAISFNGREDLAHKEVAKWQKHIAAVIARGDNPRMEKFLVVPVAAR